MVHLLKLVCTARTRHENKVKMPVRMPEVVLLEIMVNVKLYVSFGVANLYVVQGNSPY